MDNGGLDYVGKSEYESQTTEYWFVHNISEIINSAVKSGLVIQEFNEYSHDISANLEHLESEQRIPKCYILVAKK